MIFPVSARVFNVGDSLFGPANIPLNSHKGTLVLDVADMGTPEARTHPGQTIGIVVDYFDGVQWQNLGKALGMDGPWRDKQGVLHNEITVSFDFGSISVNNGPWVPRLSAAGWQVRAVVVMAGFALNSAGGTLEVT